MEPRQKAQMITDMSQGAVPNHGPPGQKRGLGTLEGCEPLTALVRANASPLQRV